MNYLLLIYLPEELSEATLNGQPECPRTVIAQLQATGQFVAAGVLRPASQATSVRVREGHRWVTDGPFAETREQLGGFLLVEANDLDEALAIAAHHPIAPSGTIEVRPLAPVRVAGYRYPTKSD